MKRTFLSHILYQIYTRNNKPLGSIFPEASQEQLDHIEKLINVRLECEKDFLKLPGFIHYVRVTHFSIYTIYKTRPIYSNCSAENILIQGRCPIQFCNFEGLDPRDTSKVWGIYLGVCGSELEFTNWIHENRTRKLANMNYSNDTQASIRNIINESILSNRYILHADRMYNTLKKMTYPADNTQFPEVKEIII